jgi:hypothetical protein
VGDGKKKDGAEGGGWTPVGQPLVRCARTRGSGSARAHAYTLSISLSLSLSPSHSPSPSPQAELKTTSTKETGKEGGDVRKFLNRILGLPVLDQNLLFAYFSTVHDAEIKLARAEGKYSEVRLSLLPLCAVPCALSHRRRARVRTAASCVLLPNQSQCLHTS